MSSLIRLTSVVLFAIILLGQVSAWSSISFWEDGNFGGQCVGCKIDNYQECYSLAFPGPSGSTYFNNDLVKSKFSITLYTGDNCSGTYYRYSGGIGFNKYWRMPIFGPKFNDQVRSFKVADFLTSTVEEGYWPNGDAHVVPALCKPGVCVR
ncbi:hypothetical protein BC939DRAFT_476570 [Gamsiella multidivaricata]|nr:hypothetical protein BGZ54_004300 [Gamsiella multidivaricata]KAI7824870.1 hypothetical protein BC939DRAFT_476570 [Gamsiella multidivaricata]